MLDVKALESMLFVNLGFLPDLLTELLWLENPAAALGASIKPNIVGEAGSRTIHILEPDVFAKNLNGFLICQLFDFIIAVELLSTHDLNRKLDYVA